MVYSISTGKIKKKEEIDKDKDDYVIVYGKKVKIKNLKGELNEEINYNDWF